MQPAFPNICGVDLGSWTTKISALKDNKYFEVLTNQANFRETPSIVAFSDAERLTGEPGIIKMKSNFQNTLRAPLRLVSFANKPSLLSQQLKFLTIPYVLDDKGLEFRVRTKSLCQNGQEFIKLKAQQFLISFLQKVHLIIQNNKPQSVNNHWLYVTVPSYFGNAQRKTIKNCAQIAGFTTAGLIEEWEALASEYFFFRAKQIENQTDARVVVFIDFGYSKFSVHICQIGRQKIQLLDQEVLKCTGARNIDQNLVNYYLQKFTKETGEDLRQNTKAMVKLFENVELQRKKLSANNQCLLNIECIMGEHDLSYNMKRSQLEDISVSVISEISSALQAIKSRIQPYAKFSTIQILGGASRMPFFQEIVRNIFNYEPSKTLNASEAMARGAIIAGTGRHGAMLNKSMNLRKNVGYLFYICIHSLSKQESFGKNLSKYDLTHKKIVWQKDNEVPTNKIVKIPNKGPVQVLLFCEKNMGPKVVGYYQFQGEENLTFLIDNDHIIRVRLSQKDNFMVYDMQDSLSTNFLVELRENQRKFQKMDQQFLLTYELRNKYQSQIYSYRESLSQTWANSLNNLARENMIQILNQCQNWLNQTHNQIASCVELTDRINSLNQIIKSIKQQNK